jgi:hypothetical protein
MNIDDLRDALAARVAAAREQAALANDEVARLEGALAALQDSRPVVPSARPRSASRRRTDPAERTAGQRSPTLGTIRESVLGVLGAGSAMTASQVAVATGRTRSSVASELVRLVKVGELTKAARGYQLADATVPSSAPAAAAGENHEAAPS